MPQRLPKPQRGACDAATASPAKGIASRVGVAQEHRGNLNWGDATFAFNTDGDLHSRLQGDGRRLSFQRTSAHLTVALVNRRGSIKPADDSRERHARHAPGLEGGRMFQYRAGHHGGPIEISGTASPHSGHRRGVARRS